MSAAGLIGVLTVLLFASLSHAQKRGPTPEQPPRFITQKCTKFGGCVNQNTYLVLDALYREINDTRTGQSCFNTSGGLNTEICPTVETCAERCAIDGIADYEKHGVFIQGDNSALLRQWLNIGGAEIPSLPRVYLLDEDQQYVSLQLLNQEFSFTVDVSNLTCGKSSQRKYS